MRLRLRACVLAIAGLEFAAMVWLVLRAGILEADWSDPRAWEMLWLPGLFIAPSGLAFVLGLLGHGLGWAIMLCTLYAVMACFLLSLAQTATVAG